MSDSPIRLVLSDVDGTLVTQEKVLTSASVDAVKSLYEAGILFAVTSGRPPKGLTMLIDPLEITTPLAGFNGGLIVDEQMKILQELTIRDDLVGSTIDVLHSHGLSVWLYQGTDWYVLDLKGPHVEHESMVCQYDPSELASFDDVRGDIIKVVGVSDDPDVVAKATAVLTDQFSCDVSATSSQTYYIDVTHRDANKGSVVDYLATSLSIEPREIVTIGDMANDVLMFEKSGVSIAMGNATDEVKAVATYSTKSNDDNGFAEAIEALILHSLN